MPVSTGHGWPTRPETQASTPERSGRVRSSQADDQQRSSNTLDGDIFQYIQNFKSDVLGNQPARILIISDENAVDYY
jgi:hypothetical protein